MDAAAQRNISTHLKYFLGEMSIYVVIWVLNCKIVTKLARNISPEHIYVHHVEQTYMFQSQKTIVRLSMKNLCIQVCMRIYTRKKV